MVQFDPASVQKFAAALYREAVLIIIKATLVGMIVLGFVAFVIAHEARMEGLAVLGVMLGGAVGFVSGLSRSAALKLQAQQALCQLSIEENARATAHYLYQAQRRAIAAVAPSVPHTQSVVVPPARASQAPPAMASQPVQATPVGETVAVPWAAGAALAPSTEQVYASVAHQSTQESHPASYAPRPRKRHVCPKCHMEGNPGATLCGYCWTKFA